MHTADIKQTKEWFDVLITAKKSQVAVMTLSPGQSSGEKGNEHPDSDQVLYVVSGEVVAEIGHETQRLGTGKVVIVPAGAAHQFRNESKSPAVTLNVYAPPAY